MAWLRAAFDAGLGGCFDALSIHTYNGVSALQQIRDIAAEKGRPNVQVYLSEFGATTCPQPDQGCTTEANQSTIILDHLNQLQSRPWVPVAIVYEACDTLTVPTVREQYFGVFRSTSATDTCTSAKPAVAAITDLYN